ncbi:MAG TPA: glycosyltransferase [Ktedonobacteraceae bacterium]|nr:glycosyltransferase [Ktedonobacteraceae bacterium]
MSTRQRSRLNTRKSDRASAEHRHEREAPVARKSPYFSVILCTYNRRNLVLTTLASLRRQTLAYDEFEVIVIDNGSGDGTLNAVRAYVDAGARTKQSPDHSWRVQCLVEPQNGLAYARNTGLLAASGEIAVFLDDDAVADPYFLARLRAAYEATGACAIGARVELRWEAKRPHWLCDDMLEMLGYFAPASERVQLAETQNFSGCGFSVKIEALRAAGNFTPFLSKRMHLPGDAEVADLCRRLRSAGCTLWYEPEAVVMHRVTAPRLVRAFFTGRAYWQGRSEVLAHYRDASYRKAGALLRAALCDVRAIAFLGLIHRPLLRLAGRPSSERLLATMDQARSRGRLQQHLAFLMRAPAAFTTPAVLFIRSTTPDPTADVFVQALSAQDIESLIQGAEIPLSWLWQHRASEEQALGIIHFYRPGALRLAYRQRKRLWFRLWLAHQWGIRIVTTDAGGWWQSTHGLRFHSPRLLERKLMYASDAIIAYTRQPDQLYRDKTLRRRARCLPHPGFRGYYPFAPIRATARLRLDFPVNAGFAYLCLASMQTERELLYLLSAFSEMTGRSDRSHVRDKASPAHGEPQLLLVGRPVDTRMPGRILKLAAHNSAIHLHLAEPSKEDIALYMGAADALVLPHFAIHSAGMLEMAMLGLSFERVVIAPNLPRFRGMLPPRASVLYEAGSRDSLTQAMIAAQTLDYRLSEQEALALDAVGGWGHYVQRLLKIYQELAGTKGGVMRFGNP